MQGNLASSCCRKVRSHPATNYKTEQKLTLSKSHYHNFRTSRKVYYDVCIQIVPFFFFKTKLRPALNYTTLRCVITPQSTEQSGIIEVMFYLCTSHTLKVRGGQCGP